MRDVDITAHVIERWQQRVDPEASWLSAQLAIRRFLKHGRIRPTPRHWMRRSVAPGTTFAFWAGMPGVGLIINDGAAVTVITRDLVRTAPRLSQAPRGGRPQPVPPPLPLWIDDDLVA